MSSSGKRKYVSRLRTQAAEATQERVLRVAKSLFTRHGIDRVTIAQIAERSQVAASTVYALFKSKEGVLRELMSRAVFGERFRSATEQLKDVHDPVKLIELSIIEQRRRLCRFDAPRLTVDRERNGHDASPLAGPAGPYSRSATALR